MRSFKCVDAFCGAGGLSIGLASAGFDVMFGFDIDPVSISTLKENPKHVPHGTEEGDIRSMLGGRLRKRLGLKVGELDLLAGGPPCQGFSVQRTIGKDDDERNLLVEEYGKLIQEMKPRFFLLENVVGLGGRRGVEILRLFIERMIALGYHVHQRVLNACDFGVPQRRKRLLVVGERTDGTGPKFRWPAPSPKSPPTVRKTIGHLPPPPEDGSDHPRFPGHRADRLSALNRERLRSLKAGQTRIDLPENLMAKCHRLSADIVGHRNVYGRMAWDDVAPTITARFDSFTRGKFGHPEQVRTISLYEGALLQTFPASFRFMGSKVEMARQIGNAVPPRLGEALGRSLASALCENSRS